MPLTPTEKSQRTRARMIEAAKQYQTGTYIRKFVAPLFQKMIRAEYAAAPSGEVFAVVNGEVALVHRQTGKCVCVTCGKVHKWDGGLGEMHTGHFLASRCNSILFEETNTAPQCSRCNVYRSGESQLFRKWMLFVRGDEVVHYLEQRKAQSMSFTRDELVDMRMAYAERLRAAERIMEAELA